MKRTKQSQEKRKLRATPEWRKLRSEIKDKVKLDMVTGRPLTRSFNLHHLSQSKDIEDYKNLEPSRYIPLNSASHDMIHFLYNIVEREGNYDVFGRILAIIMAMKQLTIIDEEKKQ